MSQLTVASAGVPTYTPRFSGRKRKFNQPSKWSNKRWSLAPGGQAGGAITKINKLPILAILLLLILMSLVSTTLSLMICQTIPTFKGLRYVPNCQSYFTLHSTEQCH